MRQIKAEGVTNTRCFLGYYFKEIQKEWVAFSFIKLHFIWNKQNITCKVSYFNIVIVLS